MWNAIDPNIIFDDNSTPWMVFGSFWEGIKLVKLDKSLIKIANPQKWYTLARRKRSFDLSNVNPGNAALEAPFLFKKNEYYYLFLSWDYCCRGKDSNYKLVVGRSKHLQGPYLDKQNRPLFQGGGTILIQGDKDWYGVGHNSIYTFDGKDYIFFHAYDAHQNAIPLLQTRIVKWINGWPVVSQKCMQASLRQR